MRADGFGWMIAVLLVGSTLGAARCNLLSWSGPVSTSPSSADPGPSQPGGWSALRGPGSRPPPDRIVIVQLQFDVLRVELPVDVTRHSTKVWNHVDELRVDASRTALLRRNGLRIGVASSDAWPALKAIFEACNAKVLRATHTVQHGLPLTLELGRIVADESIFLIAADDGLTGTTFTTGGKYLHLDYEYGVPGQGRIRLKITPEVRDLQPKQRWSAEGGRVQSIAEYRGRLFTELSCVLDLGADELLVIGPDPAQASALTVGRRFLTRRHEGRLHETILCIAPQPYRTESGER